MAHESITNVLSIVAWGTKLTFGLYEFSTSVSSASGDVNKLAREVTTLCKVLREIGDRLKEDGVIPSQNAFDTVRQILVQCQIAFTEIEALVPIRRLQDANIADHSPRTSIVMAGRLRDELDWNVSAQTKARYILGHLEALHLTLSAMLQTLNTAKTIVYAKRVNDNKFQDIIVVERLQLETIIIDQQLALRRAQRLYDEFRNKAANAPLPIAQSPVSQSLIKRDDQHPDPRGLVPYQDPSLSRFPPPSNESEDLSQVRSVSTPYVDALLSQWTRINSIQHHAMQDAHRANQSRRRQHDKRNHQAPGVESDSEDDFVDHRTPPKLNLSINDPILMHVDERQVPRSSMAMQGSGLRPDSAFSPQTSHSWGPTSGTHFPPRLRNGHQTHLSPNPSPLSSPRTSISGDSLIRPQTAFRSETSPQSKVPTRPPVPWRVRINQWYWDYHDSEQIDSNVRLTPSAALKSVSRDTLPITEVLQEHVSREAIRDCDYSYTKTRPHKKEEKSEFLYCIEGMLSFNEIVELVGLTARMRNPLPRDSHASKRTGDAPMMPAFNRSDTAPVFANTSRDAHGKDRGSRSSTVSDDDHDYTHSRSRRKREGDGRSSEKSRDHQRDSSRPRSLQDKDGKDKRIGGGMKAQTLSKIAAGAGLAALLDGLPEMLSYL